MAILCWAANNSLRGTGIIYDLNFFFAENPLFCVVSVYAEHSYLPQEWPNQKFFYLQSLEI
jgi:hypothetical protein